MPNNLKLVQELEDLSDKINIAQSIIQKKSLEIDDIKNTLPESDPNQEEFSDVFEDESSKEPTECYYNEFSDNMLKLLISQSKELLSTLESKLCSAERKKQKLLSSNDECSSAETNSEAPDTELSGENQDY